MHRLRFLSTVFALSALALWAGAQAPAQAPLAAEQLKLFQSNRDLLERLVEHGVELANADTPVARVKACHESVKDLGRALRYAAESDDPDRVVELGDYLSNMIQKSLVPSIDDAQKIIPAGTDAEKELLDLTNRAAEDAKNFKQSIPFRGKIGDSTKVDETRTRLANASQSLTERKR